MKRYFAFFSLFIPMGIILLGLTEVYAGGILTNTNQSAQFVRMLSRNASTQIDAVYFNPAGIMKLENGFHLSIHNQSIFQTRIIQTTAPLNNQEFTGKVTAPIFPSAFAVLKSEKLAFSLGFGPVGGGGSADFDKGLPSFETKIAQLVPLMKAGGYNADIAFQAQSVFWGIQGGVSAKLNDMLSAYAGIRYVPATNTYTGHIRDITVLFNGQPVLVSPYFETAANQASSAATSAQSLITGGLGNYTLQQAQTMGYLTSTQKATLEAGLNNLGWTPAQIAAMNMNTVKARFEAGAAYLNVLSEQTADIEVDTRQTGTGLTPIIGLNISPVEYLNIGLKYEHKTKLALTNDTKKSDAGLDFLKDGEEVNSDMPAIITAGISYLFSKKLLATLSFNEYLDKGVDWGSNIYGEERTIDRNSFELALGLQYDITDQFAFSLGGMHSSTGVSEQYQSAFSYSNTSSTGGIGVQWKIIPELALDTGMLYTVYKDAGKTFATHSETYDKKNIAFAIGLSYSITR